VLASLLPLLLAGCGRADDWRVEDAWIREAPPAARMLAGYATIANDRPDAIAVVGARSQDFGAVEIHETRMQDGVMRMREVPRLEVPAGRRVSLEPGGLHLMLMRPVRELAAGDRVEIVLELGSGESRTVVFEVRREAA
jgi:hypothetical protein